MKDYKFKIAFDINGNDNGPSAAIEAASKFALQFPNTQIQLIGDISNIDKTKLPENILLIKNKNVPSEPKNIRKSMSEDTSMNLAISKVINNEANAVLSSGDSGVYISTLTLKLKRLQNISRPAFMPVATSILGSKLLFLDVGANLETKAQYLVEWAMLASLFYKTMFKVAKPRVSLINIGTEDYKGLTSTKQAHEYLKTLNDINYVGFVESRELFNGNIDVAVVDGYAGNTMLKSYEGAIGAFSKALKGQILTKLKYKIGYLLLKGAFKNVGKSLDYRSVGSAWVLGVNGLAIKAHGSSDAKAYYNALLSIQEALENNLLEKLQTLSDSIKVDNLESEE
ncbi:phosphate acyltransferase PlsX [Mycoplasma sp. 21DD0573]|uniref:phosphate acyltransferase PlsX n=1 Tax=unclassified Mycoplasma TaxID=2683645 RepID=UPI002B1DB0F6|nr:phosphate acyltransferase PlsX [Mycoplasma sp. 21DD0573]MEA4276587.1 phosphate acyltransferase PlsX [Mycoplasma sp. 21DD0573]